MTTLADVLDLAADLSPEDQAEVARILALPPADRGRARVVADVEAGVSEYNAGLCRPRTPAEIMKEALS